MNDCKCSNETINSNLFGEERNNHLEINQFWHQKKNENIARLKIDWHCTFCAHSYYFFHSISMLSLYWRIKLHFMLTKKLLFFLHRKVVEAGPLQWRHNRYIFAPKRSKSIFPSSIDNNYSHYDIDYVFWERKHLSILLEWFRFVWRFNFFHSFDDKLLRINGIAVLYGWFSKKKTESTVWIVSLSTINILI